MATIFLSIWSVLYTFSLSVDAADSIKSHNGTVCVMFVIDNSGSMQDPSFEPPDDDKSRWEVVVDALPRWLGKLPPEALVGGYSIGGGCGSLPSIRIPIGSPPQNLIKAAGQTSPEGDTNLNAILYISPGLFPEDPTCTSKRIVLASDGANSCPPMISTCDLVEGLSTQHGIRVDVVAWSTDPKTLEEFECIAEVSGGTLSIPSTYKAWLDFDIPFPNPWKYIVLVLGFFALVFASSITYRQSVHVWGLSIHWSVLGAWIVLIAGSLTLYLILFSRSGTFAPVLGLVLLGGIFAVLLSRHLLDRRCLVNLAIVSFSLWLALPAAMAHAAADEFPQCSPVETSGPSRHHIVAIDGSISSQKFMPEMQRFTACYASMFARAGDEFTVIVYSFDEAGGVAEISTDVVDADYSENLWDDLAELPTYTNERTMTYYRPLADFLSSFIRKRVTRSPMLLVLGDGESDGFKNPDIAEVEFSSFGPEGVFSVSGSKGWKIAVQGAGGPGLSAIFTKRITAKRQRKKKFPKVHLWTTPAVDPCLIDPDLLITTDELIDIAPSWLPWRNISRGHVCIEVSNECAMRRRTFSVELHRPGVAPISIGTVKDVIIRETPRELCFDLELPRTKAGTQDASIHVLPESHSDEPGVIGIRRPVILHQIGYLRAYGVGLSVIGAVLLAVLVMLITVVILKYRYQQTRPLVVKPLGEWAVPIHRGETKTVGGEGADFVIEEVAAGQTVLMLDWTGIRDTLLIRTTDDWSLSINGATPVDTVSYKLGERLTLHGNEGQLIEFALHQGKRSEIGFGSSCDDSNDLDIEEYMGEEYSGDTPLLGRGRGESRNYI